MLTAWVIGYIIGVVVVVIIVVIATILILQARKIASQAAGIHAALLEGRDNTMALWEVDNVNRSLNATLAAAKAARLAVTGGGE